MAQASTVAGFPLACHAEAYASPARTEVMSILQTQPDAKEVCVKKVFPCASPAILARKNTTSYFN